MKIGLWLQDHRNDTVKRFNEVMDIVKKSDVDLLVFPEDAFIPFNNLLQTGNDYVYENPDHKWYIEADRFAKEIGKPIMFSAKQPIKLDGVDDTFAFYFSYYTNPNPLDDETISRVYFKNTMTGISPLGFDDYEETVFNYWTPFAPIFLKGQKIGMTICYDSNHPIFSALYGVQNIDIIINMTGGNVDYHKWYRYNQVRAMENECFSLVTMGYHEDKSINSYVYGFDANGAFMSFSNLMNPSTTDLNLVDSVYVYDTNNYKEIEGIEPSEPSENKYQDLMIEAGNVSALISKAKKLNDNLYVLKNGDDNVIFAVCDGETVQLPEYISCLLYNYELKNIKNKKYIIVNRRDELDEDFLKYQLDTILRVRSMENYCAVILESPVANRCYQCSMNRKSQVVQEINGKFGIDLSRTSGPEAIWKNKGGMNASWRENYELLIDICCDYSLEQNNSEE